MLNHFLHHLLLKGIDSKSPLFIFGVLIRIAVGFLCISQSENFLNYITYSQAIYENSFNNPYSSFNQVNGYVLPYPSVVLYFISIPILISEFLNFNIIYFGSFYFITIFLILDIFVLKTLSGWVGSLNKKSLISLYWLSPVLIYLTYVSASLDILVLCIFFISLKYLFRGSLLTSSLALGLALSTKTVIILTMPFVLIYLLSHKTNFKDIFIYFFGILLTFTIINFQFLFTQDFLTTIFVSSGQNRVLDSYINLGGNNLYIIPALFILIIFRGFLIKNFNRDLFMMYLAFSFGLFLIFIKPDIHWYFWLLPHLLYFYSKIGGRSVYLFHLLQTAFFLFILINALDPIRLFSEKEFFINIAYTILQVILFCNIIWVYYKGIKVFQDKKLFSIPYIVGIGGNSGTGKTTLAESISGIFSNNFSTILKGDDLHRWKRGDSNWKNFTHLNPKANLIHEDINTLNSLRQSKDVTRKIYNHDSGNFDEEIKIRPKNLIIYEGLHPFFLKNQRDEYDLKIMVLPEENLNAHWKIIRDKSMRNKTKEDVLLQIKDRKDDYERYIKSQVPYADLVLKPFSRNTINHLGDANENLHIEYELNINLPISMEGILNQLDLFDGIEYDHNYLENGSQKVIIKGSVEDSDLDALNKFNQKYLDDLGVSKISFPYGLYGLMVSIILYILIRSSEN